jgi:hypothetical protein
MRWFGLDVHRDFCEVAVADMDGVRSAGRIATRVPTLELFAQSLLASDMVALEATTGADRIVSVLERQRAPRPGSHGASSTARRRRSASRPPAARSPPPASPD